MSRYLFTGARDYGNRFLVDLFVTGLAAYARAHRECITLIQGGAPGLDTLARRSAKDYPKQIDVRTFRAKWKRYGKKAGPIRNQRMLDEGQPKIVFAFHDNLEESKGTKDMIERAANAGIPVFLIQRIA